MTKSAAENANHVVGERLTREKEPLVSCRRCSGWATETHARANDGVCSYCVELRRALKAQQERVLAEKDATQEELDLLVAKLTEPDAEKVGRLFLRGFICSGCRVVFTVAFHKDEYGKLHHGNTDRCMDCVTVVNMVLQFASRRARPPCLACSGRGFLKKKEDPCAGCRGRGWAPR